MSTLKSKLIKLGSKNPKLRKHLRPILAATKTAKLKDDLLGEVADWCEKVGEKNCQKAFTKIAQSVPYKDDGFYKERRNEWIMPLNGPEGDGFDVSISLDVAVALHPYKEESKATWYLSTVYYPADGSPGYEMLVEEDERIGQIIRKASRGIEDYIEKQNR